MEKTEKLAFELANALLKDNENAGDCFHETFTLLELIVGFIFVGSANIYGIDTTDELADDFQEMISIFAKRLDKEALLESFNNCAKEIEEKAASSVPH